LLQQGHTFTAVVAANDSMALGVYRALYEAGLHVPEDVSVVGFDDIQEAAYFTPPLTTVRHDFIQLGAQGFEYLLKLMDDPDTQIEQRIILSKLILRDSTAPLQS
jgi:DNA-binding LacI/PurR family transcriptional regulator